MPDGSSMLSVLKSNKLMREKTKVFQRRKKLLKDAAITPHQTDQISEKELELFRKQLHRWKMAEKRKWNLVWILVAIISTGFLYFWIRLITHVI